MNAWTLTGLGINAAVVLMAVTWVICRWINNAGYVEVAWSYGFAMVAGLFCFLGPGDPMRKTLITAMTVIWSLRLGTRLLLHLTKLYPKEDEYYAALREQFPKRTWLMFFGFFQLQAMWLGLLSAPFAAACANRAPGLGAWEIAGAVLWLIAFCGTSLAGHRLNRFFEWIIWVAYFIFALGTPGGWITFYCPLLMLSKVLRRPVARSY